MIVAAALVAWVLVATSRTIVTVGEDMAESWMQEELFTREMFASALWAAIPRAVAWPILLPFRLIGALLYRLAMVYGSRICPPPDPNQYEPNEELLITDELKKIPVRALAAGATEVAASGSSETLAELVRQTRNAHAETIQMQIQAVADQTVALPTVDDDTNEFPPVPYQARHL